MKNILYLAQVSVPPFRYVNLIAQIKRKNIKSIRFKFTTSDKFNSLLLSLAY